MNKYRYVANEKLEKLYIIKEVDMLVFTNLRVSQNVNDPTKIDIDFELPSTYFTSY